MKVTAVIETLQDTRLGESQTYRNMTIFPVFHSRGSDFAYLTLEEAMESNLFTATEVSESGSVPRLKVRNLHPLPVLILDGEELAGAKQNRVVNTTILLPPRSETFVPVSCTEQGRWHRVSRKFSSSGIILDHKLRAGKMASVSRSLRRRRGFQSDQHGLWEDIAFLSKKAGVRSSTGAMRDVYTARRKDFDRCVSSFGLQDGQKGALFIVDGRTAGLEITSSHRIFKKLHRKIVRSYASESVLKEDPTAKAFSKEAACDFLSSLEKIPESSHPSVGLGDDLRYDSPGLRGSALVYEDDCIHASFLTS